MRVRSTSMSNVMLRLAEALTVRSVTSVEYGPLLHLRVRGQNTVLVSLPRVVPQDSDLTLIVTYAGPVDIAGARRRHRGGRGRPAGRRPRPGDRAALPAEQPRRLVSAEPGVRLRHRRPCASPCPTAIARWPAASRCRPRRWSRCATCSRSGTGPRSCSAPISRCATWRCRLAPVAVSDRRAHGHRGVARPGTDIDKVTVAVEAQPRLQGARPADRGASRRHHALLLDAAWARRRSPR